jgi:hypothetical protein
MEMRATVLEPLRWIVKFRPRLRSQTTTSMMRPRSVVAHIIVQVRESVQDRRALPRPYWGHRVDESSSGARPTRADPDDPPRV